METGLRLFAQSHSLRSMTLHMDNLLIGHRYMIQGHPGEKPRVVTFIGLGTSSLNSHPVARFEWIDADGVRSVISLHNLNRVMRVGREVARPGGRRTVLGTEEWMILGKNSVVANGCLDRVVENNGWLKAQMPRDSRERSGDHS